MATIQSINGDSLSTGKDKINTNFDNVNTEVIETNNRISDIIAQSGTSSTEVVDARDGFTVLKDRLDDSDLSLTNNVQEVIDARGGFTVLNDRLDDVDTSLENNSNFCHVRNTTNLSFLDGSLSTAIAFDTDVSDPLDMHSIVSFTSRINILKSGNYIINGMISFASNPTGRREAWLKLNDTTFIASHSENPVDTTHVIEVQAIIFLNAGDFIQLYPLQTSGGALNVIAFNSFAPSLSLQMVGE